MLPVQLVAILYITAISFYFMAFFPGYRRVCLFGVTDSLTLVELLEVDGDKTAEGIRTKNFSIWAKPPNHCSTWPSHITANFSKIFILHSKNVKIVTIVSLECVELNDVYLKAVSYNISSSSSGVHICEENKRILSLQLVFIDTTIS